ncbi:GAF domain-containing protein [Persicobacter sp. CCB-QB2]|uniref:GAF domain-containing protein n=1 Tax=Persicobacter sp. CCB-QB2 TaxID=1561025 RepID=UPI0006A9CD55|nr:GAF domain-containing protein [Persicobacter sp. CCB-QB2]
MEAAPIFLTEVPQEYIQITSGLGDARPNNIFIVPLKQNDEVIGVMELAGFEVLATYKQELVLRICDAIAATLISVMRNEKTRKLLEETQLQAEQLRAQEEEMRQNMEEMMATQEEMRRVNEALEANI